MEQIQENSETLTSYEVVKSNNGKILLKFPFLEIPVEVDQKYFQKYFDC